MNQILKRLEIIKSSIAIEEDEIIELQIMKLNKIDTDDDIKEILSLLEELHYSKALTNIELYLSKHSGVVEYIDPQIQSLKLELKALEQKQQKLSQTKQEYLNDIDEFNTMYNLKLGVLIEKILKLEEERLYKEYMQKKKEFEDEHKEFKEIKKNIDELNSTIDEFEAILDEIDEDDENYDEIYSTYQELKDEVAKLEEKIDKEKLTDIEEEEIYKKYHEAKDNYEEYKDEYEDIKQNIDDGYELSKEDKKRLKQLWKKASKLCHPDIVSQNLQEKATQIMQMLNEAYSKHNIAKINEILLNLESGATFETNSDSIDDKEILVSKIEEFKRDISALSVDIEELKQDEIYQTIQEIDDWDEYFDSLKDELEKEIDVLGEEIEDVGNEQIVNTPQETIEKEQSQYAQILEDMVVPTFAKIIKTANNSDDELSEFLSKNGKIYKALYYSAFENLFEAIQTDIIDVVDWNCDQGLASSLLIDYIREKQIDIKINNISLIEENTVQLQRAMVHIETLKENDINISNQNVRSNIAKLTKNSYDVVHFATNLFNDLENIDYETCNNIVQSKINNNYFIIVDTNNKNENINNEFYEYFEMFNRELISNLNCKIGRYTKFEKIFKVYFD
jgi:hypothetical protein